MTEGVVRTQGTEVFVIDTLGSDPTRVKIACPTGVQGLGGAADQLDSSCLDTKGDKEFVGGLGNPGQVTIPFNLIPRETSHQLLYDWKQDGRVMRWLAALSEGEGLPTVDVNSDGLDSFIAPTDRSSFAFSGFVSDVTIDIATNELVRGTLLVQRSGNIVFTPFVPS